MRCCECTWFKGIIFGMTQRIGWVHLKGQRMGPLLLMLPNTGGLRVLLLLLLLPGRLMLGEWVVVVLGLGTRRPGGLIDWRASWLSAIIEAALTSAGAALLEAGARGSSMIEARRGEALKRVRATVRRPSASVVLRAGRIKGAVCMLLSSACSQGAEERTFLQMYTSATEINRLPKIEKTQHHTSVRDTAVQREWRHLNLQSLGCRSWLFWGLLCCCVVVRHPGQRLVETCKHAEILQGLE